MTKRSMVSSSARALFRVPTLVLWLGLTMLWAGLSLDQDPSAQRSGPAEKVVELLVSRSEHQAKVAARAMWSGFFVDMLIIPETTYFGRRPLSSRVLLSGQTRERTTAGTTAAGTTTVGARHWPMTSTLPDAAAK